MSTSSGRSEMREQPDLVETRALPDAMNGSGRDYKK